MTVEQIIRNLRGMLTKELPQYEYDTICAAIRALGGNP
jgi:hypothetical protein